MLPQSDTPPRCTLTADKERTGHATFGLGALYFVALSLLFAFIAALPAVCT